MNDLELVNKKKDELEEKIRILTLASEEKQVNVLANLKIIMEKSLIDNCDLYITNSINQCFISSFQRTISDLEGKVYNANYNDKYLTEKVQDLETKLENERYK